MFFLGGIFKVVRQSGLQWGVSIAIGSGELVVALLLKAVVRRWFPPHVPTEEEIRAARGALPDPKKTYRRHWWQWLRPPPPDHVRAAWQREERQARHGRGARRTPAALRMFKRDSPQSPCDATATSKAGGVPARRSVASIHRPSASTSKQSSASTSKPSPSLPV